MRSNLSKIVSASTQNTWLTNGAVSEYILQQQSDACAVHVALGSSFQAHRQRLFLLSMLPLLTGQAVRQVLCTRQPAERFVVQICADA